MTKDQIIKHFKNLSHPSIGFEGWLSEGNENETVFNRLGQLDKDLLSKVQLNQLLHLSYAGGVSDGFFKYYWLSTPEHTYDVTLLSDTRKGRHLYKAEFISNEEKSIISLNHLKWGITRIYIDSLMYYGNINFGFEALRTKSFDKLSTLFKRRRYSTLATLRERGESLKFYEIASDDRWLISEVACKNFETEESVNKIANLFYKQYEEYIIKVNKNANAKNNWVEDIEEYIRNTQALLPFWGFIKSEMADIDEPTKNKIKKYFQKVAERFQVTRPLALKNTDSYLSLVNDLDVYVATSMRTKQDFLNMERTCRQIFRENNILRDSHIRFFDPTLSSAKGHEDKGLIECLMVKCAKALIYCAADKESYGKDAEAAMALSLGKPVIFYCDQEQRLNFYKDVHPLSRLIDFDTGVAQGALVTDNTEDVSELLIRIFDNKMEYYIEKKAPDEGYYRLKDKLTDSVVRIQTSNKLLSRIFWNYYRP